MQLIPLTRYTQNQQVMSCSVGVCAIEQKLLTQETCPCSAYTLLYLKQSQASKYNL